jgi:flagellar basal-body rod protein FlgB
MSKGILDPTVGALNTSLNLRLMNQNVISSNIANADTPGYKAKTMEFEQALRDNLSLGDDLKLEVESGHIAPFATDPVNPEIYDDPNGVESLDGNTVNRSAQMAEMAENQYQYDAAVEMMKRKLGMTKYGITEGGGNR